ncbi:MAG: 4-alpha-glucanotransferase, partial [candidate division Zixibacteria bacterium]|nr:4-alpha-glucanotransferase [candidate division Zixibacteria bacterium]
MTEKNKAPKLNQRRSGLLLHPTSLPGRFGIGDLGPEAYRFADFLKESKQSWWQILPTGPVGYGNSPYQTMAVFAGNPLLISPELLLRDGLLSPGDLKRFANYSDSNRVDYQTAREIKRRILDRVWDNWRGKKLTGLKTESERFSHESRHWLEDFALFTALKQTYRGKSWVEWDSELKKRRPAALASAARALTDRIGFEQFQQFLYFRQWHELKNYCFESKIGIIGDVPIYVSHDSVEVWKNPHLFWLNKNGRSRFIAGVPPDYFSPTGQLWGNPLYRWDVLEKEKFGWWIERSKAALENFDAARLDHFIGFVRYWKIRAGAENAIKGEWVKVPGDSFFRQVFKSLGNAALIAEDLGIVTQEVVDLRDKFGLPGLRVLQFAFDGNPANPHLPVNCPPNCVAYTGTHDNDTIRGWFDKLILEGQTRRRAEFESLLCHLGT